MPASRHHHQQHQQQVVTSAVKEKQRLCTNCKNHDLRKVWKKHKRYCKFRDCTCAKCTKTAATRKNCAEQTAKRRARQEDEQREKQLQLNPSNFRDERSIPYNPAPQPLCAATAVSPFRTPGIVVGVGGGVGILGGVVIGGGGGGGGSPMSTIKESPLQTSSDYDDTSSLDPGGGSMIASNDRDGASSGHTGGGGGDGSVQCIDIDADSRPGIMSEQNMEHVKTILKELIGRTKDFQNLNAFRLLVLQHYTYDVDKATKLIKRAHEELKFMDLMAEKPEAAGVHASAADDKPAAFPAHQARAAGRPPSSALAGHHHHHHHHHHQQPQPQPPQPQELGPQLHHGGGGGGVRTGGIVGGLVIDYRGDPVTAPAVALEPAIVPGGRAVPGRRSSQVNGTAIISGLPHSRHTSVLQPRAMYPQFPLPLTNHATALWHHPQPPFHASNMTFSPFFESEWSRHCRFPIFNPELQPEPVNLQQHTSSHHRRPEPSRPLVIADRLQERAAAHNRPQPVNLQQDDREQSRHHA